MKRIRGVIFDIDGTLIDSNDAHAESWVRAFSCHGHDIPFDVVRPLIGMGGDKLVPAAMGGPVSDAVQIGETATEVFLREYLDRVKPFPLAQELVVLTKRSGAKIAIGSSAKEEVLDRLLSLIGITDLVDTIISQDDIANSKPSPDVIAAAMEDMGVDGDCALMIGDTPYDVAAAAKLATHTVAVRCGGWSDRALVGAIEIYDDPAHLCRQFARSLLST